MKAERHAKILQLIEAHPITTQEELLERLSENKIPVTQATISRDIKQLRLIKALDDRGIYRYTRLKTPQQSYFSDQYLSIIRGSILSMDVAGHILCLKCHTGMANAACATIDSIGFSTIVGTLSGDDTIFILFRTTDDAQDFKNTLYEYLDQ